MNGHEAHFQEWAKVKEQAEHFCFVSAHPRLQAESLEALINLTEQFDQHRIEAIEDKESADWVADSYLCAMLILNGMRAELEMWIAIREQRFHSAWDSMVQAQLQYHHVCSSCPMATKVENRLMMLECLERVLFPKQMFSSPGMVASFKCSICDQPIESCPHIRGRIYRGEMCLHIATHVDFQEFSLVEVPADKSRRIVSYTEDGVTIDKLTNGPVRDGEGTTI